MNLSGERGFVGAAIVALVAATAAAQSAAAPEARFGAPVDLASFVHRRTIPAGKAGLVDVPLDAAALAHCEAGFHDLRIAREGDGRQLPYIVHRLSEPLSVQLPPAEKDTSRAATSRDPNAHLSRYAIRLPYAHLPDVRLTLRTSARLFRREVWLEAAAGDANERERSNWRIVDSQWWSHADPDNEATPLTFDVGRLRTDVLHLAVDEGDNAPLPLARPLLLLPAYVVRFARPEGVELLLVYGNPHLDAPQYDLALVAQSILDLPADTVKPGPEQPTRSPVPAGLIFWLALALAVAGLLALIARLLTKPS